MDVSIIRQLSEKYDGGLKKLASDIGMSEANLHRCIKRNKIQASDLESIAKLLDVDVSVFFDKNGRTFHEQTTTNKNDSQKELIKLQAELSQLHVNYNKLQGKIELLTEQLHDAQELYRRVSTFDGLAAEPIDIPKKKENA